MNLFDHLFAPKQLRRPTRRRGFTPILDSLSERIVPAVTSTTFVGGILTVRCDNADDVVQITENLHHNILVNGQPVRDIMVQPDTTNTKEIDVFGNGGNDRLEIRLPSYRGADLLDGSDGMDTLIGGNGKSTLLGGPNDDIMDGVGGDDVLTGNGGNDLLVGGIGVNRIRESANVGFVVTSGVMTGVGTDRFAQINSVELTGGSGSHTYDTRLFAGTALIDAGGGNDVIMTGPNDDTVFGGAGNDVILTGGGKNWAFGATGNDSIVGGANSDVLQGNEGDDTIQGAAGDDTLEGGADFDTLMDSGSDIAIDDMSMSITRLTPSGTSAEMDTLSGFDAARLSIDALSIGGRIDGAKFSGRLTLLGGRYSDTLIGGSNNDTIFGFDDDDLMLGNDGNDLMLGYGGRDLMIGGMGADVMEGGAGEDILIGGATTWDGGQRTAPWELQEIHAEWRRTDLDYSSRVSNIFSGVGLTGAALYPPDFVDGTHPLDNVGDTLTGGRGDLDLFFWILSEDNVTDQDPAESWPGL